MPKLGDFAPQRERSAFVKKNLKPGTVIRLYCVLTPRSKEKWAVMLAMNPLLLAFVNSTVNSYIEERPYLRACQVELSPNDNKFLKRESFLDCSHVIDDLRFGDVMSQLTEETGRILGHFDQATVKRIVSAVGNARTVSPKHKRAIEDALRSEYGLHQP